MGDYQTSAQRASVTSGFAMWAANTHGGAHRDFANGGHYFSSGSENAGSSTGAVIRVRDGQIYHDGNMMDIRNDLGSITRAQWSDNGANATKLTMFGNAATASATKLTHMLDNTTHLYSVESDANNGACTIYGSTSTGALNLGTGGARAVSLGSASATNTTMNGVNVNVGDSSAIVKIPGITRLGVDVTSSVPNVAISNGNTATAANVINGQMVLSGAGAVTFPTAASVVAGINSAAVGDTFLTHLYSGDNNATTLSAGAGQTILGGAASFLDANPAAIAISRLTNVTGGAEAYHTTLVQP